MKGASSDKAKSKKKSSKKSKESLKINASFDEVMHLAVTTNIRDLEEGKENVMSESPVQ